MKRVQRIPLRVKVGYAIRRRRESMKVTQAEFAETVNVDRAYYSMIERGRKNLQLDTLERVCSGLGVKPYQILKQADEDLDPKLVEPRRVKPSAKRA